MPTELPRLFLARHGDTPWTVSGQHTGRTDLALNEQGEQHARQLGERLRQNSFVRVFTSPLERARKTCELSGYGDRAEVDSDLLEWDYGDFEGKTTTEILKANPGWQLYRDGSPNGESPEDVAVTISPKIVPLAVRES
jgi:broad specificity phosphatase PhoE